MTLDLKNVKVEIKGKEILHDITLNILDGAKTAIIGPNGAGKSTLLRVFAALNRSYTGDVFLGGKDLRHMSRREIATKIGILPQGTSIPPGITVRRLVAYGRFPHRKFFFSSARGDEEAIENAITATGIAPFSHRMVDSLSGGERQRVLFAMVLAQEPQILLLDEPTTYLDIAHQLEIMEIVKNINKNKTMTIVMVLHDLNHALQYADHLILLKDGKVKAQGAPKDIITPPLLAETFGVIADTFTNSQGKTLISPIALAH